MRSLKKLTAAGGLVILGWLASHGWPRAQAQPGERTIDSQGVVAYVNGRPISRQELGEELIARKGKDQLELLINRRIIMDACAQAGIAVTDREVEDDLVEVMKAARAATPEEFERSILRERRLTLYEYVEDVVRPALAMKKLAGERLKVTDEDLQRTFASKYGEKVRCRLILLPKGRGVEETWAKVRGNRQAFLRAATEQPDPRLAARAGEIDPIPRYSAFDKLEEVAFSINDGEVSPIIQLKEGNAILLREALLPADENVQLDVVRETLAREIMEKKLKEETPKIFLELKKNANVRNYLNNKAGDIKDVMQSLTPKTKSGS